MTNKEKAEVSQAAQTALADPEFDKFWKDFQAGRQAYRAQQEKNTVPVRKRGTLTEPPGKE